MMKRRFLRLTSTMLAAALAVTSVPLAGGGTVQAAEVNVQEGCSKNPDAYAIYPIPQNITYPDKTEFSLKDEVVIVAENGVDTYTTAFLKEVLTNYKVPYSEKSAPEEGKTNIILGIEATDGVADDYMKKAGIAQNDAQLFTKSDAYLLDAKTDNIVIEGKDTDAAYYGVATLQMMFSSFAGTKFLETHIEDYASVAKRGYIEGFYGSWNFAERENLMKFARNYKMNSYVYAAKGDPYHTGKWGEPYPAETLAQFKRLVDVGNQTKVKFAWSVHLGSFFSGLDLNNTQDYEAKYAKLKAKIKQLYDVGVRRFDVLNDDFGGGSNETVVTVLNRLNKDLKDMGCEPLTYCPKGYNQAWSGDGTELTALQKLDSDIHIYWTGADVNAPVTQETVDFLKSKSNHSPDFWLNYPVNEHAGSGIFLGDITHYARDGVTGLAGFHSNPSRFAYANEVALYQLAALVWNNNNYNAHAAEIWESAFNYLQPEVKDAYYTIAKNVSNAPNSGRVAGFPESEYLKEKLEHVQMLVESGAPIKDDADTQALIAEFQAMIDAVADFRAHCSNKELVKELEPWLKSLNDVANAGKAALESLIAFEKNSDDISEAWDKLSSAGKYYDSMYTYPTVDNGSNSGPYAMAGSKRLAPFAAKMITAAKNKLTPILNPNDETVSPILIAKIGGQERMEDAGTKKLYDGDENTWGGWNIVQKQGDYYGLDLGRTVKVRDVSIVQGKDDKDHDIFHKAVLQYSTDKTNWTDIPAQADGSRITAQGLDIQARYIRYYLTETGYGNKPDYWTHVREFTVNKKAPENDRVYTNVDALKQTPLTLDGTEISIRDLTKVTLNVNDYIGLMLKTPVTVTKFINEHSAQSGLTLEYSFNETVWNDASKAAPPVGAKYVRLRNTSGVPVTVDITKIGVEVKRLKADPTLLMSTIPDGLQQGSYGDVFDGDLSTAIVTKKNQKADTYMTFDLGHTIEVHDVTAVMSDGDDHLQKGKIQISTDNKTWTDVITVQNGESDMQVPYRYAKGDAKGAAARYLRIYFTGDSGHKLKLYEIQMNREAESGSEASEIVSNMTGNLDAVIDNNIATLFTQNAGNGSYIEYRIGNNTNVSQVSVLQGKPGKGKLFVTTQDGKEYELGTLDKTVTRFDTKDKMPITNVRIKWNESDEVQIYELIVSAEPKSTDDIGQYVPPIVIGGDTVKNIALGKKVAVSGTSDGNMNNVNDGDTSANSKWDSNYIKGPSASADSWVYIDLGETPAYDINKIVVYYHNLIYPTAWEIQVSDNATDWQTVKQLTKADGGAAHPVETIEFDAPVSGRYVRLHFTKLNANAAGNGVGVKEFEIYGKEKTGESADKSELKAAIDAAGEKAESKDYTKASKEALKEVIASAQEIYNKPDASASEISNAVTKLKDAEDALKVKVTEKQNIGLGKPVTVSGTSNGKPEYINDGDKNSKWDSDLIKGPNQQSDKAWFTIDIGEQMNLIDGLKVSYFNKVYPTKYEVQISNDGTNWTTVKTLSRDHNGQTYPADDIVFETPVSARYVRMLFTEMNNVAAGHGVGINEAEVLGRYVYEKAAVTDVEKFSDMNVDLGSIFDHTVLPVTAQIKVQIKEMQDMISAIVPASWNTDSLDTSLAGTYLLDGVLSLNGIENPNQLKAAINVIVQGGESETESETPGESETESETPGESETESETPGESETESETPGESETESETPGESETESETPGESETESESQSETESESQSETESESQSETESESQSESQSETESESQSETESESQSETESETPGQSGTESETPAQSQSQKPSESKPGQKPDDESVKTGDYLNLAAIFGVMIVSAGMVVLLITKKKKTVK